jgi:hypothetical protein
VTDDDLRTRMRRADPAASLPPIAPDDVSRLIGETMTTTAPAHVPSRWQMAAAAAFVLVVAGLGWFLTRPQPQPPVAQPPVAARPVPSSGPATTIGLPGGTAAKCRPPAAKFLAGNADFAVAGRVTGISRDIVTLAVTKVYKGANFAEVRVLQEGQSSEQMLGSGRFEVGHDYLVASAQGNVLICGYSGEAGSPGLAELYEAAF